jgi:hypothetical protein
VEQGFDPEELDSWEVGVKSTWWDGRAVTNVALFYSDYQDMQIPGSVGVDTDGDGVNDSFVGTVTNAAQSEISGIEIEGNILFTENFSAQFAASFLDAEIKEWLVGDVDVSADRAIQNTPEEMVFVGLSYNTDLAGGNLLINANYSYRGDVQQFEAPAPDIDQEAFGLLECQHRLDQWRRGLARRPARQEPDRRGVPHRRLLLRLQRLSVGARSREQHHRVLRPADDGLRYRRVPLPVSTAALPAARQRFVPRRTTVSDFPAPAPLLPEILALHGRWRADRDAVIADGERVELGALRRRQPSLCPRPARRRHRNR